MKKRIALILLLFAFSLAGIAYAHGARIDYRLLTTVEIVAAYDDGTPMAGGQVTVYAPNDPATPWLTGACDEEGRFTFVPDADLPGTWDVQVRLAGHGDIVHIPIGEGAAASGGGGLGAGQIVVMSVSVIWGLVGTALFFSRRRAKPAEGAA